ncbi:MAG: hypothetical protein ACKO37_10010 [Vampirovibrionales bacterium]
MMIKDVSTPSSSSRMRQPKMSSATMASQVRPSTKMQKSTSVANASANAESWATSQTNSASTDLPQVQSQFYEANRAIVAFTKSIDGQKGFAYENPELGRIMDDPEKGPVFALKGFTDPETGMEYPDPLVVYVDKNNQIQFQMDENTPLDKQQIWSDGRWKSMPSVLDRVATLMGEAKKEHGLKMSEFAGNVRGSAMVQIPKDLLNVTPRVPGKVTSEDEPVGNERRRNESLDPDYDSDMEAYQAAMADYRKRQERQAQQTERQNSPYADLSTAQLMQMARTGDKSEAVIGELAARMREDQSGTLAEIDASRTKTPETSQQDPMQGMMMQMMASQSPEMAQILPMLQMMNNGGKAPMAGNNPMMSMLGGLGGNTDPQMAQMMAMMQMFNGGKLT